MVFLTIIFRAIFSDERVIYEKAVIGRSQNWFRNSRAFLYVIIIFYVLTRKCGNNGEITAYELEGRL